MKRLDVRYICYDEDGALADIRYIEVKIRVLMGTARLSANEWKKARRYRGQFWLYLSYPGRN